MKKFLAIASCAAAMGMSAPASAAVLIDFDELTHYGSFTFHNPLSIDGFYFASASGSSQALGVWGANDPRNADTGGATLFNNFQRTTTTITQLGGGAFDFTSIDLADVFDTGASQNILFTFVTALGSSDQIVTLDSLKGLQTFVFNQTNVLSVSYTPEVNFVQIDNVLVSGGVSGAVPEPSTWLMLLFGFFAMGGFLRREKKSSQTMAVTYS